MLPFYLTIRCRLYGVRRLPRSEPDDNLLKSSSWKAGHVFLAERTMQGLKAELLRGFWYMALPGKHLRPGKVLVRKMLGEPVLIGRTNDGKVFAISDLCPHRGMPLHHGWFDGDTVACCYHAWRF